MEVNSVKHWHDINMFPYMCSGSDGSSGAVAHAPNQYPWNNASSGVIPIYSTGLAVVSKMSVAGDAGG